MRPILQAAVAGAVVAFAAVSAWAVADSSCSLYDTIGDPRFRANLTHSWKIPGGGSGKNSFSFSGGECYFGTEGLEFYGACNRERPDQGGFAYFVFQLDPKKITNTRYSAGVNTARMDEMRETSYLSSYQAGALQQIIFAQSLEGPGRYIPIQGNLTPTRVVGNLTARVYNDFSTYDVSSKLTSWSDIVGGPYDGRRCKNIIVIVVKRAPRSFPG